MRRLSFSAVILCALVFRQISFSQSIFEPNKIGYTPAKQRLESFEKHKYQEEFSLVRNVPFKSIGPSVMSGRVVDIEVSPDDPTIFYVAYASGGIWKTTNNRTTFFPIFDDRSQKQRRSEFFPLRFNCRREFFGSIFRLYQEQIRENAIRVR